jgi:maltodextrin utilization protein YvdJ
VTNRTVTKFGQLLIRALVLSSLVLAPRSALACPVCFGENDSPLAVAMNMGIIFMLVIVGAVLVGFASFFIYLMRRARLAAQQSETTAQC